ncbi:MAG: iron-containing alcohol dehydrogenase [Candidatus Heimdallarchaeum aukensis]|uniref:Iron-containing alcohol dehydrogenase n=1 Tax=Candidatus Heimdallarchaeum aukensis TaxID=2876573 RepID=A0A9Y1BKV7_9ARCH|nr:MAG: iron-containing alcohol dehydrogenase [Candidatus Heimdallarchaeum aukensis]
MKEYFEFQNKTKILAGKKALENLPSEFDNFRVKRPIILTDRGVNKAGLVDKVIKACGGADVIFPAIIDDIPQDSSTEEVNKIAEIYNEKKCDGIIAIGGGSVIDTAKGVNILVSEKGKDLKEFAGAERLKRPLRPLFVIPTTAGTGSEVTAVAVIKDDKSATKMLFTSRYLMPDVAVIDPRMTITLPAYITALTAMDALTHAIEAYTCLQKNLFSDVYAWKAIELISKNIVELVKNGKDKERRLEMAIAATMAGVAFSNSMVGLVHSLGHAAGAVAKIPHGVAMNIFLPHVLKFNYEEIKEELKELLLPLAGEEIYVKTEEKERARKFIEKIEELQERLNELIKLPKTLKEAGVKEEQLEEIAEKAINDGSLTLNPKDVTKEEALRILMKAYE